MEPLPAGGSRERYRAAGRNQQEQLRAAGWSRAELTVAGESRGAVTRTTASWRTLPGRRPPLKLLRTQAGQGPRPWVGAACRGRASPGRWWRCRMRAPPSPSWSLASWVARGGRKPALLRDWSQWVRSCLVCLVLLDELPPHGGPHWRGPCYSPSQHRHRPVVNSIPGEPWSELRDSFTFSMNATKGEAPCDTALRPAR